MSGPRGRRWRVDLACHRTEDLVRRVGTDAEQARPARAACIRANRECPEGSVRHAVRVLGLDVRHVDGAHSDGALESAGASRVGGWRARVRAVATESRFDAQGGIAARPEGGAVAVMGAREGTDALRAIVQARRSGDAVTRGRAGLPEGYVARPVGGPRTAGDGHGWRSGTILRGTDRLVKTQRVADEYCRSSKPRTSSKERRPSGSSASSASPRRVSIGGWASRRSRSIAGRRA